MSGHRLVLAIFLGFGLACAGLPIPGTEEAAPPPAPVSPDVEALLAAEADPNLTDETRAARAAELDAFVSSKPDFSAVRDRLLDCMASEEAACDRAESAYDRVIADYATQDPVTVATTGKDWAALVLVRRAYEVGDDYEDTRKAFEAAWGTAIPVVEVAHGVTALSVERAGGEPVVIDLTPVFLDQPTSYGFALVDADTEPTWLGWGQPDALNPRIAELTGKCPAAGCPEPATPETPAPAPAPRRGDKTPAPEPAPEPPPVAPEPVPAPRPAPSGPVGVPSREDIDTPEPAKTKTKGGKGGKGK